MFGRKRVHTLLEPRLFATNLSPKANSVSQRYFLSDMPACPAAGLSASKAIQVAHVRRPPSIPYPDLQNLVRGPVLSHTRSTVSTLFLGLSRRYSDFLYPPAAVRMLVNAAPEWRRAALFGSPLLSFPRSFCLLGVCRGLL